VYSGSQKTSSGADFKNCHEADDEQYSKKKEKEGKCKRTRKVILI